MGLYDSVDRGKPKPKRLTGPIALCCALFLLFGGLTYWACHYQFRFHAFISDLTDSTRDARSTETFRVTVNGSETDVSIDDLSDLLYLIDKAGAGRTAAAPEEVPYAGSTTATARRLRSGRSSSRIRPTTGRRGRFSATRTRRGSRMATTRTSSAGKVLSDAWESEEREHPQGAPFFARSPARGDFAARKGCFFISPALCGSAH